MKDIKKTKNKKIRKFPYNLREKDGNMINNFLYFVHDIYGRKNFLEEIEIMIEFVSLNVKQDELDSDEHTKTLKLLFLIKDIVKNKY